MPTPLPAFVQEELTAFDREADSKVRALADGSPPPFLYHYTNDVGLHGILKSGKLWFTDIFDLNDPSELRHGYGHASRMLAQRASSESAMPALQLLSTLVERIGTEGLRGIADYFVCSFSSDGDELGQWRAYADNGRGFALAFDGPGLERPWAETRGHSAFPIEYDEEALLKLHGWVVDRGAPLIDLIHDRRWPLTSEGQLGRKGNSTAREYTSELASSIAVHAIRAALLFKHRAYRNEQEYRFLDTIGRLPTLTPPPVLHRTRPYSLARYREYDWRMGAPGVLNKIIVGPAADDRAVEFVRDNLREFHEGEVEVVHSKIPYRVR